MSASSSQARATRRSTGPTGARRSRWVEPRRAAGAQAARPGTRDRLLDIAERLFAEQSFADTSVRDLTRRADCNLASVNYHFGGKENLYVELFERTLQRMLALRVERVEAALAKPRPTVERVFRAFAEAFFEPVRERPDYGRRMMQLYSREMAQPMLPPGMVYVELIEPTIRLMDRALDRTLPGLTQKQKLWCLHALVGPLVNVLQASRFYAEARDNGEPDAPHLDIAEAVDHIVLIAAAGARAMHKGNPKK